MGQKIDEKSNLDFQWKKNDVLMMYNIYYNSNSNSNIVYMSNLRKAKYFSIGNGGYL